MINSYPIWKYCTILFVLIIAFIYLIPSLYKENFVILLEKETSYHQKPDKKLLCYLKKILQNEKIVSKSIFLDRECIQIHFFCKSDQLYVYKKLFSEFKGKYFISLQKTSFILDWLHFIKAKPIQLGLDLKGGLYLILRIDIVTILHKFQQQYIDSLRADLIKKNIVYKNIYKIKNYDIAIVFKNIKDRNQAISYLSKKYTDTFLLHITNNFTIYITFSKDYIHKISEDIIQKNSITLHNRIKKLNIFNPIIQRYGQDCIAIELPGIQNISRIKSILSNTVNLEFRLVNTNVKLFEIDNNLIPEDSEIKLDNSGNIVPLYKNIILTGDHIVNSDVSFDEYHRPQVNIWLDNFGNSVISKFTKDNIGKLMATLFIEYKDSKEEDSQGYPILTKYDKIINVAVIQSQLNHNFCISGINDINEAKNLSSLLKMGSLYAPIRIEEERIIGPTLGEKNIFQGILACGLGILLSICFMVIWYNFFGLIAGLALIVNLMLMISLMSVIPGVMLTMPSIAGIALTLAVAIDANVLINERIKEEIKKGKPIQFSIYMGYKKSFNSIVDANITTMLTSVILYILGTGPIQGFAMATIIGVGTSMFTSILGTRALVNLIYGKGYINKLSI